MRARNKSDHVQAVEMIKKLSNAINNPESYNVKTLLKVLGYVQREYKKPLFANIKMYPNINTQYLERMGNATSFDIDEFIREVPSIDNPRKYVKRIAISNDPYLVITNFLKSNMILSSALDEYTFDLWSKITSSDIDRNLNKMKQLLDSIIGRNKSEIIKDVSKYTGVIIVICGTILMNYIICMIALGLISEDITFDEYIKESSDDSILSSKDYPYIISGTFPLIHVDRELEFRDIGEQDSESFAANNLLNLITNVGRYIDTNTIEMVNRNKYDIPQDTIDCIIIDKFDKLTDMFRCSKMNEHGIYKCKEIMLNLSSEIIDHDFHYDNLMKRLTWCKCFLRQIECGVRRLSDISDEAVGLIDIGSIVQMFEIICLQIWDAFITQNKIRKIIPQENQYISVIATDDTYSVIQYYNTLQPLKYIPSVSNSQMLVNNILESAGSKAIIFAESQQDSASKSMDQTINKFKKTAAEANGYLDQLKNKCLKWIKTNDFNYVTNRFVEEDKAEVKTYSYNPKNVAAGMKLLQSIYTALTDNYADKRNQGKSNINDLIVDAFPMISPKQNEPISDEIIRNIIGTGEINNSVKEITIMGSKVLSEYKKMSAYITSNDVIDFISSDIVRNLERAVNGFKLKAANAAKQPMKESVDDIFAMMEDDQTNLPSMKQPDSNIQKPQSASTPQATTPTNDNAKPNINEDNDSKYLNHAVTIASAVIDTLIAMTLDAYNICAPYNRMNVKNRKPNTENTQTNNQ